MIERQANPTHGPRTSRLLLCGIVAGPLFLGLWLIQVIVREGFDPGRHPLSLLSLGELGWIQVLNFVLTGGLMVACASGLSKALSGVGSTWGPILIGGFGVGLIVAGIFPTDAGAGFPIGAPLGAPEMSWHGAVHEVGFGVASVSWIAACVVFARRFAALGQRAWMTISIAAPLAAALIMAWPDLNSLSIRLVLTTAVEFGFVAALAAHVQRETSADFTAPAAKVSTTQGA